MQKIFINKETNRVEQILPVEISDDCFPTCYAVLDLEDNINGYNVKYNLETKEFEIVGGLNAFDKVDIIKQPTTEDYNNLKKENEELKLRLDKIEGIITQIGEVEKWQVK